VSNITRRLNKITQILSNQNITDVAHKYFVENTPIDEGNARRNTKKENNEIIADYPYAQRLEEGYSDQAPEGMSKPTIEQVRDYIFRETGIRI